MDVLKENAGVSFVIHGQQRTRTSQSLRGFYSVESIKNALNTISLRGNIKPLYVTKNTNWGILIFKTQIEQKNLRAFDDKFHKLFRFNVGSLKKFNARDTYFVHFAALLNTMLMRPSDTETAVHGRYWFVPYSHKARYNTHNHNPC